MLAGSMASTFHGETRMTRDIDMVIDRTPVSIDRLVGALDRDFLRHWATELDIAEPLDEALAAAGRQ